MAKMEREPTDVINYMPLIYRIDDLLKDLEMIHHEPPYGPRSPTERSYVTKAQDALEKAKDALQHNNQIYGNLNMYGERVWDYKEVTPDSPYKRFAYKDKHPSKRCQCKR